MSDWFVFQHDGAHLGPWSSERLAEAILDGVVASDVWVAAPGGTRWMRALDVPAIAALLDDVPLGPPRRDSGMRLVPLAFTPGADGSPSFSSTMIMVGTRVDPEPTSGDRPDAYAPTFESPTLASAAGPVAAQPPEPPPTLPALAPAPSSPTPSPSPSPIFRGGDTLASPVAPLSPRRRKNG